MRPVSHVHDVLVIGGGPSGSACAYWLAEAGWDVALVESKVFPRDKTCGDGLTPRSVRQLADMGVEGSLAGAHRYDGMRAHGYGQVLDMAWPDHPTFPSYGYVISRHDLDGIVNDRAAKAGATVWQGTEALEPRCRRVNASVKSGDPAADRPGPSPSAEGRLLPSCVGALVKDKVAGTTRRIEARYVVVADGSELALRSGPRDGRDRNQPMGLALRGYYRSPGHDQPFIESHLDIRNDDGEVVPGYGWIFPMGDGRVNAGVGLLSTERRWRGVNTTTLMEHFVAGAPPEWELSPPTSLGPPTGGKLPMGLAVGPRIGPTTVVVGDATASINPFNGEGIAYGYESGRLAAAALGGALSGEGFEALRRYDELLDDTYGLYFRMAQLFVRMISRPEVMKMCVGTGLRWQWLMEWMFRMMANLLRPDETGPAEALYRLGAFIDRLTPERS